jgi:hypothetical protein
MHRVVTHLNGTAPACLACILLLAPACDEDAPKHAAAAAEADAFAAPASSVDAATAPPQQTSPETDASASGALSPSQEPNSPVAVLPTAPVQPASPPAGAPDSGARVIFDAGQSVGSLPDAGVTQCLPAGASCAAAPCCTGTICVPDTASGLVCAAECTSATQCMSGCCGALVGRKVGACAPAQRCAPASVAPTSTCLSARLIARDGTFLGIASSNTFEADGVCNTTSLHGSQFGTDSIYNESGLYGSKFGVDSAYNQFAVNPPAIICSGSNALLGLVSKNRFASGGPVIDPDALCTTLRANGL